MAFATCSIVGKVYRSGKGKDGFVASRCSNRPVESDSLRIVKLLADPVPYWRGELEPITESQPTFGSVTLRPKTSAILTLVSHEVWKTLLTRTSCRRRHERSFSPRIRPCRADGRRRGERTRANRCLLYRWHKHCGVDTNSGSTDYGKFLDAMRTLRIMAARQL